MGVLQEGRPLRVAVAGFGQAGQCHVAAWAAMGAEIVGVHALRPEEERPAVVALCGPSVPVFASYAEMLDRSEPDLVSICTLHDTHAEQVIEAASRGLHFVVEKPICLTAEELVAVGRAVDAAGVRGFVGFQEFHYGQLQATIDAVERGWLGRVHLAEIEYMNGIGPWVRQHWWARTRKLGGSSMLFCGCHPLMLMMNVMAAEVEEVFAQAVASSAPDFAGLEYPGTQVNMLRFRGGRMGKVTSCLDSLHPYYWRTTLIGSEGTLIDRRIASRAMLKGTGTREWTEIGTRSINDAGDITPDMFVDMMSRILANLRDDAPMPASGWDAAWEMHRVLFACEESARTGRPVSPDAYLPRGA